MTADVDTRTPVQRCGRWVTLATDTQRVIQVLLAGGCTYGEVVDEFDRRTEGHGVTTNKCRRVKAAGVKVGWRG